MTVILAPERPSVATFECRDNYGKMKKLSDLQKIALEFYYEHIVPAAKPLFGKGGYVPVFVSGVHNLN